MSRVHAFLDQLCQRPYWAPVLAVWLCLLSLTISNDLAAQAHEKVQESAPLQLRDDPVFYASVRDHLSYVRDSSLKKSAGEIAAQSAEFEPLSSVHIDFGLTSDRVWLKWQATNETDAVQDFRIDMKRQYFTELDLYEVDGGQQPVRLLSHRQTDRFNKREIPSRFLVKDVSFQPDETKTFLIGYRSSTTTFLPLAMGNADGVLSDHRSELIVDLFLNGMLVAMIIYSLLMLPVIGWRLAASFAGYIGAGAFYVLVADGYPMQVIWPNHAWINEPMNLASMLLMTALGLIFCRQLFHFNAFAPRFDRFLKVLPIIASIGAPLSFLLIDRAWFTVPAYFLPPVANVCVCIAGVFAYRGGRIGALPFLGGALLVFSSLVYATLAHLIPGQFDLDATLDFGHIALLGECLAFALAILLRFLSIRQQRDDALAEKLEAVEQRLQLSEQLIESQRDFEQARRHAEQGQERLSEISHDIRQPLLVLRDAVGRLNDYEGDKDNRLGDVLNYLTDVTSSYDDRLGQPVEHSSDPSSPQVESFRIDIVMQNVLELYAQRAKTKGIDIRMRDTDLCVVSNPVSLMRVVSNLVGNAVEHSDGSAVLIAARARGDTVRIEVWDNGVGLSKEQIDACTQRGVKGKASKGSGLGLAIVDQTCEALGHQFEVCSRRGNGTAAFIWMENNLA